MRSNLKISKVLVYSELPFSLFRMFPTTLTISDKEISFKFLGITYLKIQIKDIQKISLIKNKWVHFRLSNIFFPGSNLMVIYRKRQKIKQVYLILSDNKLKETYSLLKKL